MPSGTLSVPHFGARTTQSVEDGIPTEDRGNEWDSQSSVGSVFFCSSALAFSHNQLRFKRNTPISARTTKPTLSARSRRTSGPFQRVTGTPRSTSARPMNTAESPRTV